MTDQPTLAVTESEWSKQAAARMASIAAIPDSLIDIALKAVCPGGAQVSAWLPQKDAWTSHQTARDVIRYALHAVFTSDDFARHRTHSEPRPAGDLREVVQRLLTAMAARALRGRDHVPSMRDEQDAASALRAALTHPAPSRAAGEDHRKTINTILANLLHDCGAQADLVERIRLGNSACTAIIAATPTGGDWLEQAARVGRAIEEAWNGSGSDGQRNDLPPIDLSEHERIHIGAAAIRALSPARDGAGS